MCIDRHVHGLKHIFRWMINSQELFSFFPPVSAELLELFIVGHFYLPACIIQVFQESFLKLNYYVGNDFHRVFFIIFSLKIKLHKRPSKKCYILLYLTAKKF
ncbi:hypothetical protein CHS0354_028099 [Potamilus streckersoni]|uniref:Uncharacterized protein n=1 Tax=Potamilus streckersoni TaxID=2493646 RepID=A0AAE0WDZ8_9BIVA|nr:hypothetical protein CHS0354_028099 [Potamilus streckersoni]